MLRLAFWVFVLFLALSYLNISVQEILNSPAGKENFGYLAYLIVSAWQWLSASVMALIERVSKIIISA